VNRKLLAAAMTAGALTAPVAIAFADTNTSKADPAPAPAPAPRLNQSEEMRSVAKLKQRAARTEARREARAERKRRAKRRERRLAARRASAPSPVLQKIAACESGGDPTAVGGGGAYRGKYQFDYQTWASVGGSGDPAAAPEPEQDMRAAVLYSRAGSTPWPVCGR
jgi:hypothetical protein